MSQETFTVISAYAPTGLKFSLPTTVDIYDDILDAAVQAIQKACPNADEDDVYESINYIVNSEGKEVVDADDVEHIQKLTSRNIPFVKYNAAKYVLTPAGIMTTVLMDYNIDFKDVDVVKMTDDFMNYMVKHGHISKVEDTEEK